MGINYLLRRDEMMIERETAKVRSSSDGRVVDPHPDPSLQGGGETEESAIASIL
jgi:hypothetical protein